MFFLLIVLLGSLFTPLFVRDSFFRQLWRWVYHRVTLLGCWYILRRERCLWSRVDCTRRLSDRIFGVNQSLVRLVHGTPRDRVHVVSAHLLHKGESIDVTPNVRAQWELSDAQTSQIVISVPALVASMSLSFPYGMPLTEVGLLLVYTGHANAARQIPPQTFARLHWSRDKVTLFPPYTSTTPLARGLGVKHVITAHVETEQTEQTEKQSVDVTTTVKSLAGVKGTFYADVGADRQKDLSYAFSDYRKTGGACQIVIVYNTGAEESIIL